MTLFKSAALAILMGVAALAGSHAIAAPTVITFDGDDPIGGLAVGAILSDQYAAYGVTFAPNAFSGNDSPNGQWATNTAMNIVDQDGDTGMLGMPALVSGNMLRGYNDGWLGENGDPSFSIFFSAGINRFSADFAGVGFASDVRLFAYRGATLLGSIAGSGNDGGAGQLNLSISNASLIDRIVVTPGTYDDWVGVDNISFEAAELPEPAAPALLGLGLAGLALVRRTQRS